MHDPGTSSDLRRISAPRIPSRVVGMMSPNDRAADAASTRPAPAVPPGEHGRGGPGRSGESAPRAKRPERPQAVLEVLDRTRLSPSLLRISLGGPGIADLSCNDATDRYVKLLLPDPASGLTPPYDMEALRRERPEDLPRIRTYTVRHWDTAAQRLDIDVVLHGDGELEGVAATWADSALPGDRVALRGAGGAYSPDPAAAQHLFIGDHSALPAIAAALEALPEDARGRAVIQLEHEGDRLHLTAPDGVRIQYLIGARELLLETAASLEIEDPSALDAFVHGERGIIKQLRRILVVDKGIPRDRLSISAYWALGRVEDRFQAEKREPIGRIDE